MKPPKTPLTVIKHPLPTDLTIVGDLGQQYRCSVVERVLMEAMFDGEPMVWDPFTPGVYYLLWPVTCRPARA